MPFCLSFGGRARDDRLAGRVVESEAAPDVGQVAQGLDLRVALALWPQNACWPGWW